LTVDSRLSSLKLRISLRLYCRPTFDISPVRERSVGMVTSAYSLHPGTMVTNLTTSSLSHDLTSPCSSRASVVLLCSWTHWAQSALQTGLTPYTTGYITDIFSGSCCHGSLGKLLTTTLVNSYTKFTFSG